MNKRAKNTFFVLLSSSFLKMLFQLEKSGQQTGLKASSNKLQERTDFDIIR